MASNQKTKIFIITLSFTWLLCFNGQAQTSKLGVGIAPLFGVIKQILPQNKHADLFLLIPSEQDPHSYEPSPSHIQSLSELSLYFSLGLSQENVWLEKIQKSAPQIKVISLLDPSYHASKAEHGHAHNHDPHIWNNPIEMLKIINQALPHLINLYPENKKEIQENFNEFSKKIKSLNSKLEKMFRKLSNKKFMVFHPAWAHFAHQYGLTEIAIESNGKEPGPKQLTKLFEEAKLEKIKIILIQKQFQTGQALTLAKSMKIKAEIVNDLSEDYLNNTQNIAQKIYDANKNE